MNVSTVINRRDFAFLVFEWLDLETILGQPCYASHDIADIHAIFDLVHELAENEIAPHLRASDQTEPTLDRSGNVRVLPEVANGVRMLAEAGLFGMTADQASGGLQLPHLVYFASLGMLMSASVATASFMMLTVANAKVITSNGSEAQVRQFALPQYAGAQLGTMCLSEPHAGSSLGDIRTRADFVAEDELGSRYRLRGSKMWISGGDHDVTDNIVHLVLAKAPGADGVIAEGSRGTSLFIVPKLLPDGRRNDVSVAGLNHKMGYRGIPNCALNFGEGRHAQAEEGAVGWLLGDVGKGLATMFEMMNEARVGVGLGGAMLAYRGYLEALEYARTRPQGRAPGVRTGAPIPIIEHADIKQMLLAQKCYAEGALALVLYTARLLDEDMSVLSESERSAREDFLGLLTPVTKSWPSEWAQRSLDLAIQVHGGAGYTRDYKVEQLYRDNRLNPIHEGTTGIQAIDLVGRKLRRGNGTGLAVLRGKVAATVGETRGHAKLQAAALAVEKSWSLVEGAIAKVVEEADEARAIACARPLLFAFGHSVMGWIWLDVAKTCAAALAEAGDDANPAMRDYLLGKLHACRYFVDFELPKIDAWLSPLPHGAIEAAAMAASEF